MSGRILIVEYGAGNTRSLSIWLSAQNLDYRISRNTTEIQETTDLVILPGVGHFASAQVELRDSCVWEALLARFNSDLPVLGICVGFQLLCRSSQETTIEGVAASGLGVFPGYVKRLDQALARVPHVGFNSVGGDSKMGDSPLSPEIDGRDFYFSNSYAVESAPESSSEWQIALSPIDQPRVTCVQHKVKPIFGCQFHPELSQGNGVIYLRSILNSLC